MQRTTQTYLGVPDIEALEQQQDLQRVMAVSTHRQQISRAGKLRAHYQQSSAQYVMRFQDFQKPAKRNKILAELGLDPIHLSIDSKPSRGK